MTEQTAGERLRQARTKAGMTAAELGRRAASELARPKPISASAIRNQENGTNGIPVSSAHAYARVLGISPQYLLWGDDEFDFNDAGPQPSEENPADDDSDHWAGIQIPAIQIVSGNWLPAMYNSRRTAADSFIFVGVEGWHAARDRLHAYEVIDSSLEPIFPKGTYLIAAPAEDASIYDGSLVIAAKMRGAEVVQAIRRVENFPLKLINLSTVGKTSDANYLLQQGSETADDLWIDAVVIASYRVEPSRGRPLDVVLPDWFSDDAPDDPEGLKRAIRRQLLLNPDLDLPEDVQGVPLDAPPEDIDDE